MAHKRDMRRADLIVPFQETEKEKDTGDLASTMGNTLPMAAIFTRNKMLGWTAIMFALQAWMSETPAARAKASSPAIFQVGMAALAVVVGYLPLFLPPQGGGAVGTGTEPPAAVPL
ncbi:hypothetical protein BDY17DRAFT_300359 [Neohortaea acidophila]|uniref:Uncharacterized protein n=1 Tax=Neohortaea acidophila TaxID=245834 RepID=A0A6A6PPW4_9PEZI|nr:uncharacterized protein BDY17DRAFT_300359 [Neohortaea acidophila]KAF2482138.1 hypothetical protein BDY17DRAFT_300359 [Neohortaea acidophila]